MSKLVDNPTGHIIANFEGKCMLLDTGATETFFDEHRGIHVDDISRMIGTPLDGVVGMDSLKGRVVSLTKKTIHINGRVPERAGAPLMFVGGIPCVDIRINEVPCRAMIKTGATVSYIAEPLLLRDKHTRVLQDFHPVYGRYMVRMFVNYFSIGDKNFFADAGELPDAFTSLSASGIGAVIGTDLLDRFDMVMDFSGNRLYLISN
jgi:hypothetical protein